MKRVLLCILAVLVLAVAGAALYVTHMDADFIVRRIAEATKNATGSPLELKETPQVSLMPPGIRFGTASWKGELNGNAVAVTVQGGRASLELEPLFSRRIVISELTLDRPEADIRLAAKDAGAAGAPNPQATAESAPSGRKAPNDALPFELARLTVSQGALHLEAGARDIRISGFNLTLENVRRREEADIQGDLVLLLRGPAGGAAKAGGEPAPLLEGNLAFKGALRYYAPNLTFRQVSVAFTPLQGIIPRDLAPLHLTCEGAMDLGALRLALAGARLTLPQARLTLKGDGTLAPPALAGDITLNASTEKLAALAGLRLPTGAPDTVDLTSRLDLSGADLTLNARLELTNGGQGAPEATGTLKGNGTLSPPAFKGVVTLNGSAQKLAALGGVTVPADLAHTLDVRSALDWTGTKGIVDAELLLGGGSAPRTRLTFRGNANLEPVTVAGDMALTGSAHWLAAVGGLSLSRNAPDTLDVRSRVAYAAQAVRLGGLDARAAGLHLTGDLTVGLPKAGEAPLSLSGKLRMGAIALDPWLAAARPPTQAGPGGKTPLSRAPAVPAPAAKAGKSSAGALPALDLSLAVAELRYGDCGLRDMAAHIKGQGGRYTMDGFSAALHSGGSLKGTITANLPASAYSVSASGAGINLGALCAAAGKPGLAEGSASFTARLRAAGSTPRALVASLDGDGRLEARDLSTTALREAAEKLRALPVKITIPNRFSSLIAPFTVSKGELTARPVTARAQGISLQGELRTSLGREYLEGTATVAAAGLNVPLNFKGPFAGVRVSVDPRFAMDVGKRVIPQLLGKGARAPAGQRPGAAQDGLGKAGEVLRGIFGK